MREINEIKELSRKIGRLTELFGIDREQLEELRTEVHAWFAVGLNDADTVSDACIGFIEGALRIIDYTPEQLLRFILLTREIEDNARRQGKNEAMMAMELLVR